LFGLRNFPSFAIARSGRHSSFRTLPRRNRTHGSRRIGVCADSDLTAQLFEGVVDSNDRIVLIGGTEAQARTLRDRYQLKSLKHHNPPLKFVNSPAEVEACVRFVETNSPFRFWFLAVGEPQGLAKRYLMRGPRVFSLLCSIKV
jgi:N-acetylglucosaminyldiphosphoundecaprenol N-acetyl-beta-D-mannosaminyltransferase